MKLFGSSGGKHSRRPVPPPEPEETVDVSVQEPFPSAPEIPAARETPKEPEPQTAPEPPKEEAPPVSFETVEPPPPPPEIESAAFRSEDASELALPEKRSHRFRTGYLIFLCVSLIVILAGLLLLWVRMDIYERSRPYRAMDTWTAGASAAYWHDLLAGKGVDESYLATLALDDASYYKKLDAYTDETPAYGIRFGSKTMLSVTLKKGAALPFNSYVWELDTVEAVPSGLTVFAPEDAVLAVRGEAVEADALVQRDAQPVTLGPLEATRDDIPGLAKYALDWIFTVDGLTVTDAEGSELSLAHTSGNSYYYPPLTSGYVIEAPSAVTVTVNGIPLTEENAEITRKALEDFAGLGDSIPVEPADVTYVIDGLVARPDVEAVFADGTLLAPTEATDDRWTFALRPDPDFAAEQESYILTVFDAYIAFLGNRGGDMYGNLYNYQQYLVPGSEASERASKSLDSLYWFVESVSLGDVIRYGDDCFTAWIDFTRRIDEETTDLNSLLFIFVRYNGQWRVVRVMNQTSFLGDIS